MKVDRSKALTTQVDGKAFYFCSEHCLHAFEANPHQYLHPSGRVHEAGAHAAHSHT